MGPPAHRGLRLRPGGKAEYERNELVTGRDDTTILSGLNIVLTQLYQMDIPSKTGYLYMNFRFSKGQLKDSIDFVERPNDYQHYMTIKFDIESHLQNVA
jgi:hypothetical protein